MWYRPSVASVLFLPASCSFYFCRYTYTAMHLYIYTYIYVYIYIYIYVLPPPGYPPVGGVEPFANGPFDGKRTLARKWLR